MTKLLFKNKHRKSIGSITENLDGVLIRGRNDL